MSDDKELAEKITATLQEKGIVSKEEVPEVAVEAKEVSIEDIEAEASKKGWKPDGPKSAAEFLRAEPLYDRIHKQSQQIKSLNAQVNEALKHIGSLRKAGYEDKINKIQTEHAAAVARSDLDSVNYYQEQMQNLKGEMQQEVLAPELHPAAKAFLDKYQEELKDPEVHKYVKLKDVALGNDPDVVDPYDHMKKLEEQLFKKYPDKFGEKEAPVMAVESDSTPVRTSSKKRFSFRDLDPIQKTICKKLEKQGLRTVDQYIQDLVNTGALK